ncbi:disulfide bond formation protein B [Campylobacter concisus]
MQTKQNDIPANEQGFFNLMSLAITALVALPVGIACLVLGFGLGDNPCVMCWAERITMIAISLIALFIIRYGLKPGYLAALLLMACWAYLMALSITALMEHLVAILTSNKVLALKF